MNLVEQANLIEHIVEPRRLLLSWQARPRSSDRMRCIVGELRRTGGNADLVYLVDSPDYSRAMELGFEGEYPAFPVSRSTTHERVLPTFMLRLPPRRRRDFPEFLESVCLPAACVRPDRISDFALLGYFGAKLPGDDFTVIHPFDDAVPPFEVMLLVAGHRYHLDTLPLGALQLGMEVEFRLEPGNSFDPQAIQTVVPALADAVVGHVPPGLAASFHRWLAEGLNVSATIERVNGMPENPFVSLFVRVRGN
jgi:hypothetical protein